MQRDPAPPRPPASSPPVRQPADLRRNIKYESELDPTFGDRIARSAYGEKLFSCIQCGTCSGTCPVSHYMDYTPRQIIAMIREGFREEVLNSVTIWLCASCYSCTVRVSAGDQDHRRHVRPEAGGHGAGRVPEALPDPRARPRVLPRCRARRAGTAKSCPHGQVLPEDEPLAACSRTRLLAFASLAHGPALAAARSARGAASSVRRAPARGQGSRRRRTRHELPVLSRLFPEEHRQRLRGVAAGRAPRARASRVEELDDWNCCGATAYMSVDEVQAFALAARNLALAEQPPRRRRDGNAAPDARALQRLLSWSSTRPSATSPSTPTSSDESRRPRRPSIWTTRAASRSAIRWTSSSTTSASDAIAKRGDSAAQGPEGRLLLRLPDRPALCHLRRPAHNPTTHGPPRGGAGRQAGATGR